MTKCASMTWNEWQRYESRIEGILTIKDDIARHERLQTVKDDLEDAFDLERDARARNVFRRVESYQLKMAI